MRDVLPDITRWQKAGEAVALATVVKAMGSSPRSLGAKMAVSGSGAMSGSVSGGCVEADVALHAIEVLESGKPRLVTYGVSDEQAFEVGLACGGMIDVFIEPLSPLPLGKGQGEGGSKA
jgi:xanthine/CO dehydrogenase XdhC/CoxF family maturation factor